MGVDHHLLEGVGMAGAILQAGHIGHPQAELPGTHGFRGLTAGGRDLPEHVSPLGITGQKDNPGVCQGQGGVIQGLLELSQGDGRLDGAGGAELLAVADGIQQLLLRLAAVERNAEVAGHTAQLAQGETGQGGEGFGDHGFRLASGSL